MAKPRIHEHIIVHKSLPMIKQGMNQCGLAAVAMNVAGISSGVKNEAITFLWHLFISKRARSQDSRMWSLAYLLLKARHFPAIMQRLKRIGLKDGLIIAQDEFLNRLDKKQFGKAIKAYRGKQLGIKLVDAYLNHTKTQHELIALMDMLGFTRIRYPGETMGTITFQEITPSKAKMDFLKSRFKQPKVALLLGIAQNHWVTPVTLLQKGRGREIKYRLDVNDPLGQVYTQALSTNVILYLFKLDEARQERNLIYYKQILEQ